MSDDKKLLASVCPECGSTDTEWHCSNQTSGGVVYGRLRANEVSTVFFLGCNYCSETIRTISGDEVARIMTLLKRPAEAQEQE